LLGSGREEEKTGTTTNVLLRKRSARELVEA
jgi:hypothetical protein